jgi:hypothetical protein
MRIGYTHSLLLAAFFALIGSVPAVSGQSGSSSAAGAQGGPKPEICDGLRHGDPQRLSLATSGPRSLDSGGSDAEEQASPQDSSELKSKNVGLPELQHSSSEAQQSEVFCPRPKNGTDRAKSVEPPPETGPVAVQKDNPDAPTVSYADGNLTISAQNTRLEDVIEAIRARTGISVEFPPQGMGNRVFDHVGPSPLREALMELLYGSGFNYIIKTSSRNPQIVTTLILSAQAHGTSVAMTQQASEPMAEQADAPTAYGAAGFRNDGPPEIIQPTPVATAPGATTVPGIPPGFNVQQAAAAAQKTPGQILDELQKRQLQMLDDQNPQP